MRYTAYYVQYKYLTCSFTMRCTVYFTQYKYLTCSSTIKLYDRVFFDNMCALDPIRLSDEKGFGFPAHVQQFKFILI